MHTHDGHAALTVVRGLGRAATCGCVAHHTPRPARFIWHHVLPKVCGGQTTPANLVSICDNAHYAIHVLLWQMRENGGKPAGRHNAYHLAIARQGYDRAVAAGTVGQIPKEAE